MKTKKTYCPPDCHGVDLTMQNLLCVSNVEAPMINSWEEDDSISPIFQ